MNMHQFTKSFFSSKSNRKISHINHFKSNHLIHKSSTSQSLSQTPTDLTCKKSKTSFDNSTEIFKSDFPNNYHSTIKNVSQNITSPSHFSNLCNTQESSLSLSVGPPKGQLIIKIIQAKNLKVKSIDAEPYVVCTFERNEFISQGPIIEYNESIRGIAIPKSHNSSTSFHDTYKNNLTINKNYFSDVPHNANNPFWMHRVVFDVINLESSLDINIYDIKNKECFLGHVQIKPIFIHKKVTEHWYKLEVPKKDENIPEIHLAMIVDESSFENHFENKKFYEQSVLIDDDNQKLDYSTIDDNESYCKTYDYKNNNQINDNIMNIIQIDDEIFQGNFD
ncbi:hypothetical protein PCK1_001400 [Pneumocystis canis]|nr:hypothetical protein PCK1_001400 [Pneumocystis canis]